MDKKEKLLLFWSAIAIVLFTFLFLKKSDVTSVTADLVSVASIDSITKTVKSKHRGALSWGELRQHDLIFLDDQVLTYDDSTALLKFNDGTKIKLSANSLLRISKTQSGVDLGLLKGFAELDLKKKEGAGGLSMAMGSDNVLVLTQGATLAVSSQSSGSKLRVVSGDARLISGNETISISQGEEITTKDGKGIKEAIISKASVKLVEPRSEEKFFGADGAVVSFKWQASDNLSQFSIQVADDFSFKKIVETASVLSLSTKIGLKKPQKYYWRIESNYDGEKVYSDPETFEILQEKPTRLISPPHFGQVKADLQTKKMVMPVVLKWERIPETKEYQLGFSEEKILPDGTLAALEWKYFQAKANQYEVADLKTGKYHWKVKAAGDKREDAPFTEDHLFIVTADKPVRNISPVLSKNVVVGSHNGNVVPLSWLGEDNLEYTLKFQSDLPQTVPSVSFVAKGVTASWGPTFIGKISWQTSSLTTEGNRSDLDSFELFLQDTDAVVPSPSQVFEIYKKDIPLRFSWKSSLPATLIPFLKNREVQFEYEIASDSSFSSVIHRRLTSSTQAEWVPPTFGDFYFRVRKIISGIENRYSLFSKTVPFKVKADDSPIEAPLIKFKKTIEFKEQSLVQDEVHISYAATQKEDSLYEKMKIFAELEWEPVAKVESYLLEIYSDEALKEKITSKTTTSTKLKWYVQGPGVYYYRIAVKDYWGRVSPFSKAEKFTIVPGASFLTAPSNLKVAKQPELKTSKIKFFWDTVSYVTGYKVSLYLDEEKKVKVYSEEIDQKNSFLLVSDSKFSAYKKETRPLFYLEVCSLFQSSKGLEERCSKLKKFQINKLRKVFDLKNGENLPELSLYQNIPTYYSFEWRPGGVTYTLTDNRGTGGVTSSTLQYSNSQPLSFYLTFGMDMNYSFLPDSYFWTSHLRYNSGSVSSVEYKELGGEFHIGKVFLHYEQFVLLSSIGFGMTQFSLSALALDGYSPVSLSVMSAPLTLSAMFGKWGNVVNQLDFSYALPLGLVGYEAAYRLKYYRSENSFWSVGARMQAKEISDGQIKTSINETSLILEWGKQLGD